MKGSRGKRPRPGQLIKEFAALSAEPGLGLGKHGRHGIRSNGYDEETRIPPKLSTEAPRAPRLVHDTVGVSFSGL